MSSTALQNYEKQLADEAARVRETLSAPKSAKISTKGKMFTLPDGTTNPGPLRCVILDYLSINQYYEGVYDPNKPVAPVCWALNRVIDVMAPGENVPKPQHGSCDTCEKNKFGSSGRGKACKNMRRLLVCAADATAESPLMTLDVSPTGLSAFDGYVNEVARVFNTVPVRVVTSISFDPNKAYPSLQFSEPTLHENLAVMMDLRAKGQLLLTREPEVQ